jgi:uncharacterized membrane protein YfcA
MGLVLVAGGLLGSVAGVQIFVALRALGQVELLVSLCYVFFLGVIGLLMLIESLSALRKRRAGAVAPSRRGHAMVLGLPLKIRFRESKLYISAIPPFLLGVLVGALSAVMGVGGGFLLVPAMIYMLGMPTGVVIGTSLFQIVFVTGFTTILHAVQSRTVDVVLAVFLLVGGVIGAQIGAQVGSRMKADQLRVLLAMLVLGVCAKMAIDLFVRPRELYSLAGVGA